MTSDMTSMDELLVRVEQLEGSSKRLQLFLVVLGLLGGIIMLMGSTTSKHAAPPIIEAQQFVLKDATGTERGSLFANNAAWGLVLYNSDSSKAAAFVVSEYGNSVLLNDRKGKSGIALYAKDDESSLAMFDGISRTARVELKNTVRGSALGLRDENGTDRVDVAFGSPFGGGVVINDANSTTRTLITEDVPSLATFDAKGSFLWAVGFDGFDKEAQKRIRDAADALTRAKQK